MKSIKLKNDTYLDESGVHHNIAVGYWTSNFNLNQEWVAKNFDGAKIIGKKLSLKNGRIYIGKNVKKIRVNATLFLENIHSDKVAYIFPWLYKNNSSIAMSILSGGGYYNSIEITDIIVDVVENDFFYISINNPSYSTHPNATVRSGIENSRMYIEVVE